MYNYGDNSIDEILKFRIIRVAVVRCNYINYTVISVLMIIMYYNNNNN